MSRGRLGRVLAAAGKGLLLVIRAKKLLLGELLLVRLAIMLLKLLVQAAAIRRIAVVRIILIVNFTKLYYKP